MRTKKKKPAGSAPKIQHSTLREYFVTTVQCTIFALFVTTYVVHPMTVPTPSMEPTILSGDRLLIDKSTIRNGFKKGLPLTPAHAISRGDILVFKYPENPEVLYVKRLIGLPGETLEIRDTTVHINGKPLDEPYKYHENEASFSIQRLLNDFQHQGYGPVSIPDNSYFMMGDNRDNSQDSRTWGFLPHEYILGRPLFVFWSYEDDPGSYMRTDYLLLYWERIVGFFPRTRWTRFGHLIR